MKFLKPYFPIFKFVAVFAGFYFGFSIVYYFYLQAGWSNHLYPDPVTAQVSYQAQEILKFIGFNASTVNSSYDASVILSVDNQAVYRVIEGCNALSVMILFTAFIVAFAQGWKKTIAFIMGGLLFIYVVNIVRLVLLAIVYKEYESYADFAHEIIFPAVIYGAVVLLWIYWISTLKSKSSE